MKNFVSFKGRSLNYGDNVEIYRNLKNHKFSVRVKGLVVGYVDEINLVNVKTKVNRAGYLRALRESQKNVHAFICGEVVEKIDLNNDDELNQLYYNPFEVDRWVLRNQRNVSIQSTNYAILKDQQVFVIL